MVRQHNSLNLKATRNRDFKRVPLHLRRNGTENTKAGFTITEVHLDVKAKIPGASKEAFETAANNAKAGCPISRLLNAKITMDASLEA